MLIKRIKFATAIASLTIGLSSYATAHLQEPKGPASDPKTTLSDKSLPEVQEILDRAVQALGGKEKLQSVKSMVSHGSLSIPSAGIDGKVVIRQTSDAKFKMVAEIPGVVDSETGSDGKSLWEVSSVTGAEILDGARAEQARFQMALFPQLDMKKYFDSMECTGKENFAGEECYVVVYKNKKSPPMTTYYSVKTGLEKGNQLSTVTAMGDMNIVTEVKAYAEISGIKYASEVEAALPNGLKQVITIEKVEINTAIAASEFTPSKEVADLMKK